ncbi:hypothetical protein, partial [Methanoculleus chikugoensis]|uniref:hypothetical protein n=1 Tax=Methanoculleus chikugoensis TaxID=118126 RepID=UPI001FB35F7C
PARPNRLPRSDPRPPAPVPGNGTYVNATYGYAVTCPEGGWFYTESGESVWFSSPDKHEEVRVNTNPLSTQGGRRERSRSAERDLRRESQDRYRCRMGLDGGDLP